MARPIAPAPTTIASTLNIRDRTRVRQRKSSLPAVDGILIFLAAPTVHLPVKRKVSRAFILIEWYSQTVSPRLRYFRVSERAAPKLFYLYALSPLHSTRQHEVALSSVTESEKRAIKRAIGTSYKSLQAHRRLGREQIGLRVDSEQRRRIVALSLLGSDLLWGLLAVSLANDVLGAARTTVALPALLFLVGFFWIMGLYTSYGLCPVERSRIRLVGIMIFAGAFLAASGEPLRLGVWLEAASQAGWIFLILFYAELLTRKLLIGADLWGAPTAFVGEGIEQAYRLFASMPELGLRPMGVLRIGRISPPAPLAGDLPVLGFVDDLARESQPKIECVIVTSRSDRARILNAARVIPKPPRVLLVVTEPRSASALFGPNTINLSAGQNAHALHSRVIKRTIDLMIGIPSFLIALPVIGVLALAIKFLDPGPAFYSQVRVSFRQRSFEILKLRTMHCDAEERLEHHLSTNAEARREWHRFCKLSHDPRVLPCIGNIIRRLSLDELPQLWNVIRGNMSSRWASTFSSISPGEVRSRVSRIARQCSAWPNGTLAGFFS